MSPLTTTSPPATGTRCSSTSSTSSSASTSRRIRCPSAAGASTRCRSGRSPATSRSRRCSAGQSGSPTSPSRSSRICPSREGMRDAVRRVDRDKARVDFVKRYSDLYGAYTEAEVIYTDDVAMRLYGSLSKEDRARFPFDAAAIDWKHYLQDVHSPAVTQSLRELARKDRARPTVKIREREEPVLAVFDMEGTIISSNVVESYVWARMADLEAGRMAGRARGGVRPDPALPGDRSPRSRGLPADVLPPVRGRVGRGAGAARRPARGRVHAAEGEPRRDPPDPGASGGRAPHAPAHGRRERVPPSPPPAVRSRDRRRPPGGCGGSLHRVHVEPAARRRGASRVAPTLRGRAKGST